MNWNLLIIFGAISAALLLLAALILWRVYYPGIKKTGNGPIEIAFVGDSITYGWGTLPNRNRAFATMIPGMLGEEYRSVNYGLGGRTLLSSGSMPYFSEKNARIFQKSTPDVVVFMLGTNDSARRNWNAAQFEKEYREAVTGMLAMPSVKKVYVMLPPKIFVKNPGFKQDNEEILAQETIPAIRRAVEGLPVTVIDLYTPTTEQRRLYADALHPNAAGNRMLAEQIVEVMRQETEL